MIFFLHYESRYFIYLPAANLNRIVSGTKSGWVGMRAFWPEFLGMHVHTYNTNVCMAYQRSTSGANYIGALLTHIYVDMYINKIPTHMYKHTLYLIFFVSFSPLSKTNVVFFVKIYNIPYLTYSIICKYILLISLFFILFFWQNKNVHTSKFANPKNKYTYVCTYMCKRS